MAALDRDAGGVFIAFGSNLGERDATIGAARAALEEPRDVRIVAMSSLYETAPVGGPPGQSPYLNAVAEIATALPPRDLLARLLAIEARFGRVRGGRDGPRTLDLDLLLYRDERINEPGLVVPHARMWQRDFVLAPLREVCGARRFERLCGRWGAVVERCSHDR